jgi:hypothetical protein
MNFITKEEAQVITGTDSDLDKKFDVLREICSRVYSRAVEDTVKKLPSVISRLLVSIPAQKKLIEEFFQRNPSFNDHKAAAVKIIERIESDNPSKDYAALLSKAEPEIKRHIAAQTKAKAAPMDKPVEVNLDGNGVL